MSRNQNRVYGENSDGAQPQAAPTPNVEAPPIPPQPAARPDSPFNFVVPTEMVDLPSQGQYYSEGHPLHGADSIEIRHMTAKEEDILTSATLLRKGIALDKMLESIIVDRRIKVKDLLIGDKNALLIASRIYGYGALYSTKISCPECNITSEIEFNLEELKNKTLIDLELISKTDNGTFLFTMPKSGFTIEFRLLTAGDENSMIDGKKSGTMKLLKLITVAINDQTDKLYVERALQSLPILDASALKKAYAAVMPDVNLLQEITCGECGDMAKVGVPLNADFFWPDI